MIAVGSAGLDRAGLKEAKTAPLDAILRILEKDELDILAAGRALIGDPQWARKVALDKEGSTVGYDKDFLKTLA